MLLAGLGIVAALAFVLGLGALALYALKRFGVGTLSPRNRLPVEVVQRVPLGPKTGLAVVRVGERVMALSVGEGGVRPLFELEESDRQHVIATSAIAVPHRSSESAAAAFSTAAAALTPPTPAAFVRSLFARRIPAAAASHTPEPMPVAAPGARYEATSRDFHAMLGMSLRDTTRLAVFAGAIALGALAPRDATAQARPDSAITPPVPVAPVPVTPPLPLPDAAVGVRTATPAAATPALASPAATNTRTQPAAPGAPTAARRAGNGADLAAGGVRSRRPSSDMRFDSAAAAAAMLQATGRASSATPAPVAADDALMRMMPQMDVKLGNEKDGGLRLNGTVGIVVMMGLMTLLPTLVLMMTGFTRILIVLHFLKQAMGTQGAPPAHLLAGLALLLTGFVMAPTLAQVNREALTPWLDGKITQVEMLKTGSKPMRDFMVRQTRPSDIKTFIELSRLDRPDTIDDVPLHVLMSAFVASELRTAFQIGFAIYLPFIIIDAVVASVLMSMGMFMLPPAMISMPFKLLLFVLVDGWSLTIQSLVQSFK